MKAFSKLFCAMFSIILILSLVFPCFAVDVSLEDELEGAFMDYCVGKVPMQFDDVKEVSVKDVYTVDDIVVFSADSWKEKDHGRVLKTVLSWDITASYHHFPYDLGIYVYKNKTVNTLEEAVENGTVTNLDFLNDFYGITSIHHDFLKRCTEAFLMYKNTATSDEIDVMCTPIGSFGDYDFFRAKIVRAGTAVPTIVVEDKIGNYLYSAGEPYGPEENPTGLYALHKSGTVCQAFELYESGILTDEEIAKGARGIYSTELDKYNEWEYEEIIIPALKEKYSYVEIHPFSYSEVYVRYAEDEKKGEEKPVYALFFLYPSRDVNNDTRAAHIVNDLVFEQWYIGLPFTYGYGIYIFETGEFYDFIEVPELKLDGKEILYKNVNYRYRMGDNNGDYELTIQDATYMQKCLVGLKEFRDDDDITKYFNNPEKDVYISDYNRDGGRNIKDVTAIQKRLAGIEVE